VDSQIPVAGIQPKKGVSDSILASPPFFDSIVKTLQAQPEQFKFEALLLGDGAQKIS
jgi:hypothetical protein